MNFDTIIAECKILVKQSFVNRDLGIKFHLQMIHFVVSLITTNHCVYVTVFL